MRNCRDCANFEQTWFEGGECRGGLPHGNERGTWPTVKATDWCAQFAKKDSTATQVVIKPPVIQE
jgi:hypothetical protein